MPPGAIHFVTETGQYENGVPGKKRLSKINSHVARFSHNRRKNNKNNTSTTSSGAPTPLQLDFVIESPRSDESRSSTDSPKSITSHPSQLADHDSFIIHGTSVEEVPECRRSTGSPDATEVLDNKLTRHQSAPVDLPDAVVDRARTIRAAARRHSEEPYKAIQVPRLGSLVSPLQLGTSIDLYEKYLLSYYFTELPTLMFGFHRDALYCPYRTDAARTIQRSPSALHWILVTAEQQLNQHAPEPTKSVTIGQSVLKRRANGYGILRNLLNNPNFDHEEAIITLRYAISAECYIFNADACGEHLKALDALLQQPGILNFFAANPDRIPITLSGLRRVYVNAPISIKRVSEFENIKSMVFRHLRHLQSLSKQSHAELIRNAMMIYLRRTDDGEVEGAGGEVHDPKASTHSTLLGRYVGVKRATLFSKYALEAMNATCDPQSKYSFQAGLFGLFYGLENTLANLGKHNQAGKITFLQRLKSILDGSSQRSLGASAITALVDRVREQYYIECVGTEQMVTNEIDIFTHGINATKLFALLDDDGRVRLTAALRAWLMSDISMDADLKAEALDEAGLNQLEEQITAAWWKEHLSAKSSHSPVPFSEP